MKNLRCFEDKHHFATQETRSTLLMDMSSGPRPLGTVELNTPITSSSGLNIERSKSPLDGAYVDDDRHELKIDYIQLNNDIQVFIKQAGDANESHIVSILNKLESCYSHLKHFHAVNQLKQLIKQHLVIIGKLLCHSDVKIYEYLSNELISLYNRANWDQIKSLDDLLLTDFTISNSSYLSTLKILTLQYIIKTKQMVKFNDTVLQMFAYDTRFLLKDSKIKINATIKILLSFFSIPISYNKVLIGLKVIQYVKQYNLLFENYIKNINIETFTKQLRIYASRIDNLNGLIKYLNLFYSQFILQDSISLRLSDLIPNNKITTLPTTKILSNITKDTFENVFYIYDRQTFHKFVTNFSGILQDESIHIENKLIISNFIYQRIISNISQYDKNIAKILDQTILFLNTNLSLLSQYKEQLINLLNSLKDIAIYFSEYQRSRNLVNICYNAYLVFKDDKFLKMSVHQEIMNFLLFKQHTTIKYLANKFYTFLNSVNTTTERLEIFTQVFHFHLLSSFASLEITLEFCKEIFAQCYKTLHIHPVPNFNNASEVQMAILFAHSGLKLDRKPFLWSPTAFILYNVLNDGINKVTLDDARFKAVKYHFLYEYETLIKLCFYLKNEMMKRSSSNLFKLAQSYQNKFLQTASIERSSIEENFVQTLLLYLNACQFHKASLELIDNLLSHKERFPNIEWLLLKWKLNASISLMMDEDISHIDQQCVSVQFESMGLTELFIKLDIRLQIMLWNEDINSFHELFSSRLPKMRPELFDIQNVSNISTTHYIKVLLFNIQLFVTSSKLHSLHNNLIEAVIEAKKSLKLSITLLKKSDKLSQDSRLTLIQLITASYENLISIYCRIGVGKDAEFYANEFSKTIGSLLEPTWVFKSLIFLKNFYIITENNPLIETTIQKAKKVFNFIQKEHDIESNIAHLFVSNRKDETLTATEIYFSKTRYDKSLLPLTWRMETGEYIEQLQKFPRYNAKLFFNKSRQIYHQILKQIKIHPFYSNLLDSTLALPSCQNHATHSSSVRHDKSSSFLRSSNMTPKLNNSRYETDIDSIVDDIVELKNGIELFNVVTLTNFELSEMSSIYSHSIMLLTHLNNTKINEQFALTKSFNLTDICKTSPLLYDKFLNCIERSQYEDMTILTTHTFQRKITDKLTKINAMQEKYDEIDNYFNLVSISVCAKTNALMVSKFASDTKTRILMRIPLNSEHWRDLDAPHFSFKDAQKDLNSIIEQNNYSVSRKVTSSITTSDGRRKWWESRYMLDKRLKDLIEKIERCWFGGFQGIFNDTCIDEVAFEEFKMNFYKILQQYLPSRRKAGESQKFISIQDWILELFVNLNRNDVKYVAMIDDLIYFVLDILQYHGERNAYDEIDMNQFHIELVEYLKRYQSKFMLTKGNNTKRKHTFLIVSDECHSFPWENLNFLRKMSISRAPSYTYLYELLEQHKFQFPVPVSIRKNIGIVLNPHGDLNKTEARFKDIFCNLVNDTLHSSAIIGEKPEEKVFLQLIRESNLFIYVGHGSGDQYARLKCVKQCDKVATSFLLGCSSASMKKYGLLQPTGSTYSYLQGGSPFVLGNLWDVTDKDIDKFSVNLFERSGLIKNLQGEVSGYQTVNIAASEARAVCHLRYLNGASPVCYGLPIAFV